VGVGVKFLFPAIKWESLIPTVRVLLAFIIHPLATFAPSVSCAGPCATLPCRQAAGIAAAATDVGKEFVEMLKEGDEIEWRDQEKAVRGLGLLLGGRWSALNVTENVGKQVVGFGDNAVTTDTEKLERKAKMQRPNQKKRPAAAVGTH